MLYFYNSNIKTNKMKKLTVALLITLFTMTVQAQDFKIIPARLYGAIPNDGHNDKPVLKYLIRIVQARPNTFILLEPGKYDVKKLRIDYEILQDMGRIAETGTPEGYIK